MKKALMIASMASMLDNFNSNNISLLRKLGYDVTLAANFESEDSNSKERVIKFKEKMLKDGYTVRQIDFTRKISNISKNVRSYRQVKQLSGEKFDLVHCHSPICAAMVRFAFRHTKSRVVYTAHGFHFYKGAPWLNWFLYYPVEKWLSRYTDVLITINREDYRRAKRKFHAKQIVYIPGVGVDVERILAIQVDRERKRKELGLEDDDLVLLSVGELSKRKNHGTVVKALSRINNSRLKYVICGQGGLKENLEKLAKKLGVKDQLILLGFRTDVIEICKSVDAFVFPSIQEGLPVALMEAMACGLPCAASKIRGNIDLLEEGKGGKLISPFSATEWAKVIDGLMESKEAREKMGRWNQERSARFSIDRVQRRMERIYENECGQA